MYPHYFCAYPGSTIFFLPGSFCSQTEDPDQIDMEAIVVCRIKIGVSTIKLGKNQSFKLKYLNVVDYNATKPYFKTRVMFNSY